MKYNTFFYSLFLFFTLPLVGAEFDDFKKLPGPIKKVFLAIREEALKEAIRLSSIHGSFEGWVQWQKNEYKNELDRLAQEFETILQLWKKESLENEFHYYTVKTEMKDKYDCIIPEKFSCKDNLFPKINLLKVAKEFPRLFERLIPPDYNNPIIKQFYSDSSIKDIAIWISPSNSRTIPIASVTRIKGTGLIFLSPDQLDLYALTHERGHIENGHSNAFNMFTNLLYLDRHIIRCKISHCLELEADYYAFTYAPHIPSLAIKNLLRLISKPTDFFINYFNHPSDGRRIFNAYVAHFMWQFKPRAKL